MADAMKALACAIAITMMTACELDRGKCLRQHVEHHHKDAYFGYEYDFIDDDFELKFHNAEDWNITICDEWEFPNGKAEKD